MQNVGRLEWMEGMEWMVVDLAMRLRIKHLCVLVIRICADIFPNPHKSEYDIGGLCEYVHVHLFFQIRISYLDLMKWCLCKR